MKMNLLENNKISIMNKNICYFYLKNGCLHKIIKMKYYVNKYNKRWKNMLKIEK